VSGVDLAFPTFKTDKQLLAEAKERGFDNWAAMQTAEVSTSSPTFNNTNVVCSCSYFYTLIIKYSECSRD
jgi:hypothetical protein